jgi:quinol monooxygenase YgiN
MAITVVATVRVRPGSEERFLKAVAPLLEHVLQNEPDTLVYLLHRERGASNGFLFYEVYADEGALAAHSSSEVLQRFFAEVSPLLEGQPEIRMYEEVGGKR